MTGRIDMGSLGWPFLVTCNRWLDYRTVVAPDFMVSEDSWKFLAEAAGGAVTPKGKVVRRKITGTATSTVQLSFRVINALTGHIGEGEERESSEPLRDPWGRKVYLIEGLVVRSEDSDTPVTESDLDCAHAYIEDTFREFWTSREWSATASSSLLSSISSPRDEVLLEVIHQPEFLATSKEKHAPKAQDIPEKSPPASSGLLAVSKLATKDPCPVTKMRSAPTDSAKSILRISNNGRFLAGACGARLLLFDLTSGKPIALQIPADQIIDKDALFKCVSFDPRYECTVAVAADTPSRSLIKSYDCRDLGGWPSRICEDDLDISQIAFSSQDSLFMVQQGNLYSIEYYFGLIFERWRAKEFVMKNVAYLESRPEASYFLVIDDSEALSAYDRRRKNPLIGTVSRSNAVTTAILGGNTFASAHREKEVVLWNVGDLLKGEVLFRHSRPIISLTTACQGNLLASRDDRGTIKFWSARQHRVVHELQTSQDISALCLHPKASFVAIILSDGRLLCEPLPPKVGLES